MKLVMILLAALASAVAFADEPKYQQPGPYLCPRGQATTYVLQCDPGTRQPIDEVWALRAPGVAICRAQMVGCSAIRSPAPAGRPGFEVQDASSKGGELVSLTFGLEWLLGWPNLGPPSTDRR